MESQQNYSTPNRREYPFEYRGTPPTRRKRKFPIGRLVIIFIVIVVTIILFLLITRPNSNPFIRHQVFYDDSLTDEEKSELTSYFESNPPSADLTISAENSTNYDKNADNKIIYATWLPVTGFYSPEIYESSSDILENATIFDKSNTNSSTANSDSSSNSIFYQRVSKASDVPETSTNTYLLPLSELSPSVKLLAVDDDYFLDSIAKNEPTVSGALFRIFKIDSDDKDTAKKTASDLQSKYANLPTEDNILTFNQTGVTALTRQMQNKLNATGDASLFSAKIADFLRSTDYTHTSNEVSFADDCNNNTPMAFCADYRMFKVLEDSGIDIVELTGNHNNDWGASANKTTIDFYHDQGIKTVGGGKTEEEAKIPLEISDKNTNITLIAINNSTSSKENGQGASGDHPGANIYDEETTLAQIKEAKDKGNFVIVDIQFAECYSYPDDGEEMPSCDLPISGQEEFFKSLIDAGADMIVGTQAHQPQTYELYNDKSIYYGLGNLFFDQYQWPGTERSLVLTHYFRDGKLLQTKVTPTMYDRNFQTAIMDKNSAYSYINRLTSYYR